MKGADWALLYEKKKAFWKHDGTRNRPHALISRRQRHSNAFFFSEVVMGDARILDAACLDLMRLLALRGVGLRSVDRVVVATVSIPLSYGVSQQISRERGRSCLYAGSCGAGAVIQQGEHVLIVDDALATGRNVDLAVDAVEKAGGMVLPVIGALVNRSGISEIGGREVVALIEHPASVWTQEECPLCKSGSRAICPKQNWAVLNNS